MDVQFTVGLHDPLSYSLVWLIVGLVLVLLPLAVFLICLFRYKRLKTAKEKKPKIKKPLPLQLAVAKQKYERQLRRLHQGVSEGKVEDRVAYQEMSRIIRMFVYDVTRVEVHHFGYAEISAMQIPQLTELVREYYEPEFAARANADVLQSLLHTRQVIAGWR